MTRLITVIFQAVGEAVRYYLLHAWRLIASVVIALAIVRTYDLWRGAVALGILLIAIYVEDQAEYDRRKGEWFKALRIFAIKPASPIERVPRVPPFGKLNVDVETFGRRISEAFRIPKADR